MVFQAISILAIKFSLHDNIHVYNNSMMKSCYFENWVPQDAKKWRKPILMNTFCIPYMLIFYLVESFTLLSLQGKLAIFILAICFSLH